MKHVIIIIFVLLMSFSAQAQNTQNNLEAAILELVVKKINAMIDGEDLRLSREEKERLFKLFKYSWWKTIKKIKGKINTNKASITLFDQGGSRLSQCGHSFFLTIHGKGVKWVCLHPKHPED